MGLVIDINDRVTVELRRESFILTVGDDDDDAAADHRLYQEFDYRDAEGINAALFKVLKSDQFLDDTARRLSPMPRPEQVERSGR